MKILAPEILGFGNMPVMKWLKEFQKMREKFDRVSPKY